jgi:diguanylate cyclase (GGDEF)-like protein
MIKTTLQSRLTTLLVAASVILIAVFTFIQINNQMRSIQELNLFRAKQSSMMARDQIEDIFSKLPESASRLDAEKAVKDFAQDLTFSGIVQTVVVFDNTASPVVLEGDLSLAFEEEKDFIQQISVSQDKAGWLVPVINKEYKLISLFVAVDNPYGFIFKFIFSLGNIQEALNHVYGPVLLIVIAVVSANFLVAAALSRAIIRPISELNKASKEVASGNLEAYISLKTQDELQELSETFNYMTLEIKKMKSYAENANPLTKLPGNIVIREEAENRINMDKKFVLIYSDLDNFKAFNDKYGVHAGDEAIMLTANIMTEAVAHQKSKDDFVGHEGGDDFLILTAPDRAQNIADHIIEEFDNRIKFLYSQEDLQKGCIEAHDRDTDEIRKFPIMTISLCGVGNYNRKIESYAQLTNIASELKKLAKKKQESCFVMDRRVREPGEGAQNRTTAS